MPAVSIGGGGQRGHGGGGGVDGFRALHAIGVVPSGAAPAPILPGAPLSAEADLEDTASLVSETLSVEVIPSTSRVQATDLVGGERGGAARAGNVNDKSEQWHQPVHHAFEDVELESASEPPTTPPRSRVFHVSTTVRVGGALLTFCAGIVNAIAFYALSTFVSHTTGTFAKAGLALEDPVRADAADCALLILSFVVGSMVCGLLIGQNTIHFGLALYDFGLLAVSALLVSATLTAKHKVARYFATAACGLQNGMSTHWGGSVIRTTHVTGLFTDAGLLVGRLLCLLVRRRCRRSVDKGAEVEAADDLSKLSVLLTIAVCFFLGIFTGAHLFNLMEEYAFLVPASATGTAGLIFFFYRVSILGHRLFSVQDTQRGEEDAFVGGKGETHDVASPQLNNKVARLSDPPKSSLLVVQEEISCMTPRSHATSGGHSTCRTSSKDTLDSIASLNRAEALAAKTSSSLGGGS